MMDRAEWLDRWFTTTEDRYLNLEPDEALAVARNAGIEDVRVIDLSGERTYLTADLRPRRLNMAIEEGRVIRAAFF